MLNVTKLHVGDVVYLKDGSSDMVVSAVANNLLTAVWFEGDELMERTLPADHFELKISASASDNDIWVIAASLLYASRTQAVQQSGTDECLFSN